jgi:hypothetical protein
VSGRFGPITLHAELADILREHSNPWMTADELASEVNLRGKYQKQDGSVIDMIFFVEGARPSAK